MPVSTRIGYRAKPADEKLLLLLADHLERDISDTLRFAVRHTARSYGLLPAKAQPEAQNLDQGECHDEAISSPT